MKKSTNTDLFSNVNHKKLAAADPLFEEGCCYIFQVATVSASKFRNRTVVEIKFVTDDGTIFIERFFLHTKTGEPNDYAIEALQAIIEAALHRPLDDDEGFSRELLNKCVGKYVYTNIYHDEDTEGRIYEHLNPYDLQHAESFDDAAMLSEPNEYDLNDADAE